MMTPNVPASPTRRRLWWLLALPIVALSLAGVARLLTVSPQAETAATAAPLTYRPVIAFGYVDIEDGIRKLYATVPGGQVTEVFVKEGEAVPAGAVLLRLDDTQARKKVDEARAAVEEAKAAQDRGRSLPEQHRLGLDQAKSAIDAAEAQRNVAKEALERKQELARIGQLNPRDLAIAQEELRAAEEAVRIKQTELQRLKLQDPQAELRVIAAQVNRAEALLAQAEAALKQYSIVAPAAGTVLQVTVGVGDTVGGPSPVPAIQFCPEGPRVVRAYVEQAFAALVTAGQRATVEDDTHAAGKWTGRVKWVSDWYSQQRPVLQTDPNQYTDVRTMECLIQLDPNQPHLRINQRVRVTIEIPNH